MVGIGICQSDGGLVSIARNPYGLVVVEVSCIHKLAKSIAYKAHEGQKRKDGSPYIKHVELVVAQLEGNRDAQVVAWLHDVIEDSEFDEELLLSYGIERRIVNIVGLLTKRKEQRYEEYITQVKQNEVAVLEAVWLKNDQAKSP